MYRCLDCVFMEYEEYKDKETGTISSSMWCQIDGDCYYSEECELFREKENGK